MLLLLRVKLVCGFFTLVLAINLGIGVLPNGGACGFDTKGLPGIAIFFSS